MDYIVKFDFNTVSKNGLVSGKSGEVDITTACEPERLRDNEELIQLIANDMAKKTKKSILSVTVTDVRRK
jgi:hypothetical protein